jgi:hypothetical protein
MRLRWQKTFVNVMVWGEIFSWSYLLAVRQHADFEPYRMTQSDPSSRDLLLDVNA